MSNNDGGTTMMMMVSMMIISSCISFSLSSLVFVAANEDWLTGQPFDWLDMDWWNDFKGWFGFAPNPEPTPVYTPPNNTPSNNTTGTNITPAKYKDNCVYLYTGKDAKSGYIRNLCVDKKNTQKSWKNAKLNSLKSLRVGREVRAYINNKSSKVQPLKINGSNVEKPFNLDDKGFKGKPAGISLSFKEYDKKGDLENVGKARDEKYVYLYDDVKGKSFLEMIRSKASGPVKYSNTGIMKRVSSMRVGKDTVVWISKAGSTFRIIGGSSGTGTKNVIDLSRLMGGLYNNSVTSIVVDRK